ncbi:hypothetical protein AE618_03555 [Bosea vaviloviae]|uniref:Uncharacterized protein n=1 Tax=Bosea vaviloviae TaxID=1526658 RepID=A0A0N1N4J5_9HYPH|nr:hypothetical protein AE618_03555 [Bosea vaviloviae]
MRVINIDVIRIYLTPNHSQNIKSYFTKHRCDFSFAHLSSSDAFFDLSDTDFEDDFRIAL